MGNSKNKPHEYTTTTAAAEFVLRKFGHQSTPDGHATVKPAGTCHTLRADGTRTRHGSAHSERARCRGVAYAAGTFPRRPAKTNVFGAHVNTHEPVTLAHPKITFSLSIFFSFHDILVR